MKGLTERFESYQPLFGGWTIDGEIDYGSFARVYRVRHRDPFGMIVDSAVKIIPIIPDGKLSEKAIQSIVREKYINEVNLMAALRGLSNVVSYEDHAIKEVRNDEGRLIGYDLLIRMELLTSLHKLLQDSGEKNLTEPAIRRMGMDLCRALARCHKINVLHRDIKPKNIFVNHFGDYKLGDFGIAHHLEGTMYAETKIGTEKYAAPEVVDKLSHKYGALADIYSLGIVLYEQANENCIPFFEPGTPVTRDNVQKAIDRRNQSETIPMPLGVSEEMGKVILKACAFSPKERYKDAQELYSALQRLGKKKEKPKPQPQQAQAPDVVRQKPDFLTRLWSQLGISVIETPSMKYMEERLKSYTPAPKEPKKDKAVSTIEDILMPEQAAELPRKKSILGNISKEPLVLEDYREIGGWAFRGRKDLTELELGGAVERVGEEAFAECTGLIGLTVSEPVEEIGTAAFRGCTKLEECVLPESTKKLGERAFLDCASLRKIHLPDSLTDIPQQVFSGCRSLEDVRISSGVKSIGAQAFNSCGAMKKFRIPDNVEHIGARAFAGCKNMQSVILPTGLHAIPESCFLGCSALEVVKFQRGIEVIEDRAFRQCEKLFEIRLPYGLKKIGVEAFAECKELEFINVPDTVVSIGQDAFGEGGSRLWIVNTGKLTVITTRNSYPWNFCVRNGIRVKES